MGNQHKRLKRIQTAAAGVLTLSMAVGVAVPAWAAESSAGASAGASAGTVPSPANVPNAASTAAPMTTERAANITREEAEARFKQLFPLLREAKLDQITFGGNSYPPASEAVWSLQWTVTSEDGRSSHGFSTEIDAMTGDVISAYIPEFMFGEPAYYPPKVSREQARKAAERLIAKAVPSLQGAKLTANNAPPYEGALFGPFRYSFTFETEHNGIPMPFNAVHVSIDGNGNVTHLSYRPIPGGLPEANDPIAKEKAADAYKERLELQLAYVNVNRHGQTPKWVLAWTPSPAHSGVMDAITGEWLGFDGKPLQEDSASVQYEEIASAGGGGFQPEKPSGATITQQRASAIVASAFGIPDNYSLEQHVLQNDYASGKPVWRLHWRQKDAPPFGFPPGLTASVDAATGQIYEVRKEMYPPFAGPSEAEEAAGEPISEAEARRKADDLVAKLYPDAKRTLKRIASALPNEPQPATDGYLFVYQPFYNGYPLQDHSVRVTLGKDGEPESYLVWSAGAVESSELPKEASVGKAEAERLWLERSDFRLQYERFGGFYVDNGERVEETTRLTYRHQWKEGGSALALDAATGEWVTLGYAAPFPANEPVVPTDIEGHAAEEQFRTLAQFRVLDTDEEGRANPNAVITRAQWARWLAAAVEPHSLNEAYYYSPNEMEPKPYYADVPVDDSLHRALRVLAQMRWIKFDKKRDSAFGPDQAVTREELAIWAARVLRYDRLAELLRDDPQIAEARDFRQIEHPGAAALAVKLELLPIHENGRWEPDREVTRAEAASLLMQLVRLQASVDQQVHGRMY
ncbi:YcdB/YcdC domain-containing protein [Paenibacillus sp.]|uniref:YcdB/YcdC domain-containing protein n=1 Tax=Paenibacillus sp. TaxID=58172 RepID=UPI002D30C192|nr:YcdB/YcdC domain-containing protein [Paenibacillus sp.]HZG86925.1 YcdB/YcdC domain-containing protein [Paenibacillus sp.]